MASLWLAVTGLAGCATDVPLGDQSLQETDTQHQMLVVFARYPVPLPVPGNKFEAYTLVSYNPDGLVAGVDAGLGQAGLAAPSPINIRIRADDAEFIRAEETTLAVRLTRFLEKHEAGAANTCTVLVSCAAGQLCWNRVDVDRGSARKLPFKRQMRPASPAEKAAAAADTTPPAATDPCGDLPMLPGVGPCVGPDELTHRRWIPLELPSGRHAMRFTSLFNTGEPTGELDCRAGQVFYATLSGTLLARLTATQQLQRGLRLYDAVAEVAFTSAVPQEAAVDSVVIYYDDD